MQLNIRVSKKKLCLFGKFRHMRHLLVVVSNLTGDFLDSKKYGCRDWCLRLGAVVVWCTLLDMRCLLCDR